VTLLFVVVVMTSPSGTAYMGGQKMPQRDEEFHQTLNLEGSISLVIVDSHFIDWGITQGRLSLPTADVLSTIVKRLMLTDIDKLSSCSRFCDSVVGFTGQKTQPPAAKY